MQVEQLYFRLDNEARSLQVQPEIASVKVRKKLARIEPATASTRLLLHEPCTVTFPKSVEDDPKVWVHVPVRVQGLFDGRLHTALLHVSVTVQAGHTDTYDPVCFA